MPVNADRTGYHSDRMCSYFRCIHTVVVNVLSVLCSSKKLFAHCPIPASHTQCARFWGRPLAIRPNAIPIICLSISHTCDLCSHLSADRNNLGAVGKLQHSCFKKSKDWSRLVTPNSPKSGVSVHGRHNEKTSMLVTPGD